MSVSQLRVDDGVLSKTNKLLRLLLLMIADVVHLVHALIVLVLKHKQETHFPNFTR